MKFNIIITGSRNYSDKHRIFNEIDKITADNPGYTFMIHHGGCSGADIISGEYANINGIITWIHEADWKTYGKGAGPIRNKEMLNTAVPDIKSPHVVLAFPLQGSRGTIQCINYAKRRGMNVVEIDF
jgi:hypothetical protein